MDYADLSSGKTASLWLENVGRPTYLPLSTSVECDVCIIGAGIAGLTVAYAAIQEKLTVIVLEDGEIGSGETGRTSAHLSNALDDRYYFLEEKHGKDGARLAAESHTAAIAEIERIASKENISCEFKRVNGYLFSPVGEDSAELEKEFMAATRAGIHVTWAAKAPWPSYDTGRCITFPQQAQFHPMKYLDGLAAAFVRQGGQIFTHTHAATFPKGELPSVVTKSGYKVAAKSLVMATNVPVNDRVVIQTKQAAYRSYVIAARIPQGTIPQALYWDTADPYHYIRLESVADSSEERLIIGGEDHKTGQENPGNPPYRKLESWARERFPNLKNIDFEWSGQVIEPVDGLAYIGRNPTDDPNVYIVTGDSGNGLTHGTLAGRLIVDLIQGRPNPWAALYDPKRKTLSSSGDFLAENANVAPQYLDWITPGTVKTVEQIKPDYGEIIRDGIKKIAVYRDPQGALHACSAVCPHLQALVRWNDDEKSWDCPAHGSRFDPEGHVLNGPAANDLTPLTKTEVLK